ISDNLALEEVVAFGTLGLISGGKLRSASAGLKSRALRCSFQDLTVWPELTLQGRVVKKSPKKALQKFFATFQHLCPGNWAEQS
ncbi:hypothetical protein KKG19_02520, partial [Patescibacteria group bacterium]|nr:hypothetical protein [Patescibacteria group bacterium]